MSVYIVTGKLGSGKTLLACMKAQEYLTRRCPVASNIEFNLEHLCRPTNDYSRFVRLPDMPTSDDLLSLGMGCDKYDEENFGAIFLDEAGIWLNSRKWNSSGRIDLLEFFLYLRKRRWDLWLLVQNIDVVDKQIRQSIAEHVVYCSRSDKYQMPFFPKVMLNVLTLGLINFVKMPKFHTAVCKYGVSKLAPNADVWHYRGVDFYNAYNTMQQFDPKYDSAIYSVLPPAYTLPIAAYKKEKYRAYLKTLPSHKPLPSSNKIMRLTKIYFKKFRVLTAFSIGGFVAFFVLSLVYVLFIQPLNQSLLDKARNEAIQESSSNPMGDFLSKASSLELNQFGPSPKPEQLTLSLELIRQFKILSYSRYPNGLFSYRFISPDGSIFTQQQLSSFGYTVLKGDRYHVQIKNIDGVLFFINRS